MVKYILVEEGRRFICYFYYANGEEDKKPGIIIVDKEKEEIDVIQLAEDDFERMVSVEELNLLIKDVNEMRTASGEPPYELETNPERSIFFGDHAVSEIRENLLKGVVPNQGVRYWY